MKEEKNKAGRPTKLTPELIDALKKVIDENIYCTDKELVFLLNEELAAADQISYETFSSYKLGRRQQDNELYSIFVRYIKKLL